MPWEIAVRREGRYKGWKPGTLNASEFENKHCLDANMGKQYFDSVKDKQSSPNTVSPPTLTIFSLSTFIWWLFESMSSVAIFCQGPPFFLVLLASHLSLRLCPIIYLSESERFNGSFICPLFWHLPVSSAVNS
jgi:hypothetical protein